MSVAFSSPAYEYVDMGGLPPLASRASAFGMNDVGQIVGSYYNQFNTLSSFFWENGQYRNVVPNAYASYENGATDINNHGNIVGWYYPGFGGYRGYLDSQSGFSILPGDNPPYPQIANAINDQGIVVGNGGYAYRHYLGNTTGIIPSGGLLLGRTLDTTIAGAINSSGTIAGIVETYYPGVVDSSRMSLITQSAGGTISVLADLTGLQSNHLISAVTGINDSGAIIGYGPGPNYSARRSFIYQNGTLEYLPNDLFPQIGVTDMYALAINNSSQIVGSTSSESFYFGVPTDSMIAWLLQDDAIYDLNQITTGLGGMKLRSATAINELGEIAGYAYNPATGENQPFLLRPVPEPSAILLIFVSSTLLVQRKRRYIKAGH